MSEHIVKSFDEELQELAAGIAEMGGLAESLVDDSVTALARNNGELAQEVIRTDIRLDQMQRDLEEKAIIMLARRQPMALDLRQAVAVLRISGDLERVGDLAKNIAKRALAIDGQFNSKSLTHGVEHIAELAMTQLKAVLDAYAARDIAASAQIRARDQEVDALYTSLFRELLTYMMEDPRNISQCTHLLFCAKNIERIGDHATNIAETIHYLVTGEQLSDERVKDDLTSTTSMDFGPAAND
ncbi:phosphate transport system protein [Rhodobium orientis]|uniref:Phosphate-specific transport system accessory protein PhoU n=1 Tax=Rhodobium orientis TaxID=34017 RepID=A0A327JL67_9HYPH|nr:phosphate signaling complex protein PhoU [Rhodobium orientis]MBB4304920.1 phosphate transport system protein [Rhodobium orientis]MBK5951239.1 phosphate transport system regulatory protein PhoU [Rhodobium orientis]RAI27079.1 phosphate transport system regulatory protein PhoU [Rhodobium orientis]